MDAVIEPFDRRARRRARDRAAPVFGSHSFLKDVLVAEIVERLATFDRAFARVLDLGAHDGRFAARLPGSHVVAADAGFRFAHAARGVMCDEDRLPFAHACFDAVLSAASLHGVNDLPGSLVQIRKALRPGGVFLASFVGGASLQGLRSRMIAAESQFCGGVSPRLLPMIDPREAPSLLQRAGFVDPVVDVDTASVRYGDARSMVRDLRGMGESNILARRSRQPLSNLGAALLAAAVEAGRDVDDRISVSLEIVSLSARAP